MIATIIFIVIAYLCGSISTGVLVCKLFRCPDPRTQGSKNPGATNVLRIGGKKAAIVALIGDVLKGLIPVAVARLFNISGLELGIVGMAAFFGHLYPIFFGFKGGKGVATSFGVILALSPFLGGLCALTWLIVATLFRYSSLAALISALLALLYTPIIADQSYFFPLLIMVVFLFWCHRGNIQRLVKGTEAKIKLSK